MYEQRGKSDSGLRGGGRGIPLHYLHSPRGGGTQPGIMFTFSPHPVGGREERDCLAYSVGKINSCKSDVIFN